MKGSKQWAYPKFNPKMNIADTAYLYAQWVRQGKPLLTPEWIEAAFSVDREIEAHMFWFEEMIAYVKDNGA